MDFPPGRMMLVHGHQAGKMPTTTRIIRRQLAMANMGIGSWIHGKMLFAGSGGRRFPTDNFSVGQSHRIGRV
jgi:hypothetical protein